MRNYELLDFGGGRKLERFDGIVVDRPCPAATVKKSKAHLWSDVEVRYTRTAYRTADWEFNRLDHARFSTWKFRQQEPFFMELELALLPSGQLGVFPEQSGNWAWVYDQVCKAPRRPRILNLFAYTGASTIAAAAGGGEVTHVDASKPAVERASRNARLSGLEKASIRWIVDDAAKYCRREARRGSRYDGVILDPPSYGHGIKGEMWRVNRDLPALLATCGELTAPAATLWLLTCHTTGIDPCMLQNCLAGQVLPERRGEIEQGTMCLRTTSGRELPSGVFSRWSGTR